MCSDFTVMTRKAPRINEKPGRMPHLKIEPQIANRKSCYTAGV
jgi:hypothetical protein